MDEQELRRILQSDSAVPRVNAAVLLTPDIYRNAARLRKRRRDRMALALVIGVVALFLLCAAGILWALRTSENPEALLRPIVMLLLGGMGMTLLLSPILAWQLGKDEY